MGRHASGAGIARPQPKASAGTSAVSSTVALRAVALAALLVLPAIAMSCVRLIARYFARRVVTPASRPNSAVRVLEVSRRPGLPDLVWLRGPEAALAGEYSYIFDGGAGHARLGPVLARRAHGRGGERVARELLRLDRGRLRSGARGRITGWWYTDPAECGASAERVTFPGETGALWAWLVRPQHPVPGRWAVHVHGRGALPEETLRGVLPLSRAGVTSLVLAYRGDPGSAPALHGRYGLGLAEAHDVDAAVAEAIRRGAERVTLVGWSMGAGACVLAANRGAHRAAIDGLALDSPALDWTDLLLHQARLVRLPGRIARRSLRLLALNRVRSGAADGIDFAALDAASMARELRVPVLVQSSPGDTFVPEASALRLAAARPELVTLRRAPIAEHVKLWNTDPLGWEGALERFVRELPYPPPLETLRTVDAARRR